MIKFTTADHRHEPELRHLMRQNIMPGKIEMAFGREPDLFESLLVEGKTGQIIAAVDDGTVLGMGQRCIKPMFVNGSQMNFGYLCGLRSFKHARRNIWLARGYEYLKKLHADGATPAYLTTIIESNADARKVLTSGRCGLPRYFNHGKYFTYAIRLKKKWKTKSIHECLEINRANESSQEELVSFLKQEGSRKQFFPVLETADFGTAYLRNLSPSDFYLVRENGVIIGAAARWDQRRFKQNIVCGYNGVLRTLRRPLNALLRCSGYRPLPEPGLNLDVLYASFICVRDSDPDILRIIIDRMCFDACVSGHHYLMVGLHERDRFNDALSDFPIFRYDSRLYIVCWEENRDFYNNIDRGLIPYLELATL